MRTASQQADKEHAEVQCTKLPLKNDGNQGEGWLQEEELVV